MAAHPPVNWDVVLAHVRDEGFSEPLQAVPAGSQEDPVMKDDTDTNWLVEVGPATPKKPEE